MLSDSEMLEHLKQEINSTNQHVELLAEVLRGLYSSGELSSEFEESIEDLFNELNLDL